jgi:hypothetical protein
MGCFFAGIVAIQSAPSLPFGQLGLAVTAGSWLVTIDSIAAFAAAPYAKFAAPRESHSTQELAAPVAHFSGERAMLRKKPVGVRCAQQHR